MNDGLNNVNNQNYSNYFGDLINNNNEFHQKQTLDNLKDIINKIDNRMNLISYTPKDRSIMYSSNDNNLDSQPEKMLI
jgi:hypothetical protein